MLALLLQTGYEATRYVLEVHNLAEDVPDAPTAVVQAANQTVLVPSFGADANNPDLLQQVNETSAARDSKQDIKVQMVAIRATEELPKPLLVLHVGPRKVRPSLSM